MAGHPVSAYGVIAAGFAAVFATMLAVELLGRAGRTPLRPAGDVVASALAGRVARWLVMGVWLWLGFHFLAR